MGIECGLMALSKATFDWIKADPERASTVVRALEFGSIPDHELLERLRSTPGAPAVFVASAEARIQERAACRAELLAMENAPRELRHDLDHQPLDLDKDWPGLESLLRQLDATTGRQSFAAIAGGQEVGPADGYGPARFLDSARVASISQALHSTADGDVADAARTVDRLRGSADIGRLASDLDALLHRFHGLQRFYRDAARDDLCIAIVLR